ncbi:uncharacterized protein FYW47_015522 [Aplochiton taeniatus]
MTKKARLLASLRVSPERSQFFEYESVSLSCEEQQGSSTGWRVKRYSASGMLSDCGTDWGAVGDSKCFLDAISSDSGVYWCESDSGEHSNAVNITVTAGAVILESPVLPVMEGEAVTLRCRYNTTPSNLTTDFYKDGSLIRTESTGEMTIPAVSTYNEGLYKCHNSDLGESPQSGLTLKDLSPPTSLRVSPERSQFFEYESVSLSYWGTLHGLDCNMISINGDSGVFWCESVSGERSLTVNISVQMVASPYLLTSIILGVKYHRRNGGTDPEHGQSDHNYDDVINYVTTEHDF